MTTEGGSTTSTTTRAEAIVEFLEGEGVNYELIEHEPTMSGADEARTMHQPPDQVAKTIVLHDGSAYVIAAIPPQSGSTCTSSANCSAPPGSCGSPARTRSRATFLPWRSARCRPSSRWCPRPR
jgi:hypothetical protein